MYYVIKWYVEKFFRFIPQFSIFLEFEMIRNSIKKSKKFKDFLNSLIKFFYNLTVKFQKKKIDKD